MFYIYTDRIYYLVIKGITLRRTKDIKKASFFIYKKEGLSWRNTIYAKYPEMKMVEAQLTVIRK